MSLPKLDLQRTFFEPEILFPGLGKAPGAERFSFFAGRILPELMKVRPALEKMYCTDNGRPAEEPVRMLAALILQFMERLPDRQAAEACSFDLRWKLALGMEAGEEGFHPTSLVKFRERLLKHGLERLGFKAVLAQMSAAGYLGKHSRQRLDSTHIIGLVSRMSRLDCVREALRLVLEELAQLDKLPRPLAWAQWWERNVESGIDYKSPVEVLNRKMSQAGSDVRDALIWINTLSGEIRQLESVRILMRAFAENFELSPEGAVAKRETFPSGAMQNPHNPDAQWSTKNSMKTHGWVGHKVQVSETVEDAPRISGEPTKGVITSIITQAAPESDKEGMVLALKEQEQLGIEKPKTLYVDAAYVSGPGLAKASAEGLELMGPTLVSPNRGVYTAEAFNVDVERRSAVCPSGHTSTQCARMKAGKTGRITYRFEWCGYCQSCAVKAKCLHKGERDRMLRVNEHHTFLQARRRVMRTEEFKKEMHHRNGIEGTQSELVRGYGMRQARYRGRSKVRLQNYLIGAACNIKRWCRRVIWETKQGFGVSAPSVTPQAIPA